MLSYEICKQLKDKGFPTPRGADEEWFTYDRMFPTLEELVEACGDDSVIVLTIGKAITTVLHGKTGLVCKSSIPKEAVANLYLKLNCDKIK